MGMSLNAHVKMLRCDPRCLAQLDYGAKTQQYISMSLGNRSFTTSLNILLSGKQEAL
jgi:hypothetical protein